MGEKPEEQRKGCAEEKTGDDGEIKSSVLAAMHNVARESAEAKWEFAAKIEKCSDEDKESAEKQKHTAEFAERVHRKGQERRGPRQNATDTC